MQRTLLLSRLLVTLMALAVAAALAGCRSANPAGSADASRKVPYRPNFIVGADISAVPAAEERGIKFSDNGVQKDILQILKDHGFNYIRLRHFRGADQSGRLQPAGLLRAGANHGHGQAGQGGRHGVCSSISITATPGPIPANKPSPSPGANCRLDQLVQTMHDYTKDVITQLKAAGGEPDMVQIGNEITPGMLLNATARRTRRRRGAKRLHPARRQRAQLEHSLLPAQGRHCRDQGGGPQDPHRASY